MIHSSRDMETFASPHPEKKAFWGHFRFSEGYTYFRKFIVIPFLWSFGGVNQLYTTFSSRDTKNHGISPL